MRVLKVFLLGAILLAAIAGLFWQFFLADQVRQARIGAAYTAKQYCSCRFVGERPAELCRQDFTADVSAISFHESGEPGAERVTASALWGMVSQTATHTAGFGCALED